jgi:hypothetical protein
MSKVSAMALQDMAKLVGTTLEIKGPWVREVGQKKWVRRRQMYQRFYGRLRRTKCI